jgi:hypothetical protein
MRGLLVRVGIDQTYGSWNAPCRADGSFCYVPIPEDEQEQFELGFATTYHEFEQYCQIFAQGNGLVFPYGLRGIQCHLDPDFRFLSYGDSDRKATRMLNFFDGSHNNFIAFYASFKQIGLHPQPLVYAIIGLYRFQNVVWAKDVPLNQREQNAHTRLANYRRDNNKDIVIFADKKVSGRLKSLIEIGEQRNNHHYYIREQLLNIWGRTSPRTGWIQRSACLPNFLKPDLFLEWFNSQNPEFVSENNILY